MQNLLAPDEDRNRPTRRDYYPILAAALARLDENTAAARRAVYEQARTMLAEQVTLCAGMMPGHDLGDQPVLRVGRLNHSPQDIRVN